MKRFIVWHIYPFFFWQHKLCVFEIHRNTCWRTGEIDSFCIRLCCPIPWFFIYCSLQIAYNTGPIAQVLREDISRKIVPKTLINKLILSLMVDFFGYVVICDSSIILVWLFPSSYYFFKKKFFLGGLCFYRSY